MKLTKSSSAPSGTGSPAMPDTNTSPILGSFLRKWSSGTCGPHFGAPKHHSKYTQSEEDLVAMQLPKVHTNRRPSFDPMNNSSCRAVCQSPLDKRYKTKKGSKKRGSVAPVGLEEVANSRILFSSVSTGMVELRGMKSPTPGPEKFGEEKVMPKM